MIIGHKNQKAAYEEARAELVPLISKYMAIRRIRRDHFKECKRSGLLPAFNSFNYFLEDGIIARQCIRALKSIRDLSTVPKHGGPRKGAGRKRVKFASKATKAKRKSRNRLDKSRKFK